MALIDFLSGTDWKPSSFPNFYVVGKGESQVYMCAYIHRNGKSKKAICEIMKCNPGIFDFHHIVEKQHLADISADGMLDFMHQYEIPTVMLHNEKHHLFYNSILHIKETRDRYLGKQSSLMGVEERQRHAIKLSHSYEGRKILKSRVVELIDIYHTVYEHERVKRKIAHNILNHYSDMF